MVPCDYPGHQMFFFTLLLASFVQLALFQGAFFPTGLEEIPVQLQNSYLKFFESYSERAAAYDELFYLANKNSFYEDTRSELLNVGYNIYGSATIFLNALCQDAVKLYFESELAQRKQYADLLKIVVADMSMHNIVINEQKAAFYFTVIYRSSEDDSMYRIAFDHIWRNVRCGAGHIRLLRFIRDNFDPEDTKIRPINELKVCNLKTFFEPIFFRIKDFRNYITIENAQNLVITMLETDAEANLLLLQLFFETFSFEKLQENARLKLAFAEAAMVSFSIVQLAPSNLKLTDDGSQEHNIANGAFYHVLKIYTSHFYLPSDFDHEAFRILSRTYNFLERLEPTLQKILLNFKEISVLSLDQIKQYGATVTTLLTCPWFFKVSRPNCFFLLTHYAKSANRHAKRKIRELEQQVQEFEISSEIASQLHDWRVISHNCVKIANLGDYIDPEM